MTIQYNVNYINMLTINIDIDNKRIRNNQEKQAKKR